MRKLKRNSVARIKRKNQTSRKRASKANKQNYKSFVRRTMDGDLIVNDTVPLYSK